MIKEIKKNRFTSEVETFLNSLIRYDNNNSITYYTCFDYDYLYISKKQNCIIVHKLMKSFGLSEQELFDIVKKFTTYEKYDVIWNY